MLPTRAAITAISICTSLCRYARSTGESFGNKAVITKANCASRSRTWRKSWATLTNRHLKRYGHKATIDERSLRAQGIKRTPTRHRGPQPKAKRIMLNALRDKQPPQPVAPIVRTTKTTKADGSISIRAVITNSALNNISKSNVLAPVKPTHNDIGKTHVPAIRNQTRKGWPPEAIAAWNSWGHKIPALFFRVWAELIEGNSVAGGPSL